jgi:putative membrane protein
MWDDGGWGMWGMHGGGGWWGLLVMAGLLVLVIAGAVLLAVLLARSAGGAPTGSGPTGAGQVGPGSSPADRLLDERYARGEIDEEEYLHRRAVLRGR